MKILAIEVMSNAAGMLLIDGTQKTYEVTNLGKALAMPKGDTTIKDLIDFQTNFATHLQKQSIDRLVLCESGKDAKKMRVRMEFAILSECKKLSVDYKTYPTGSCTRIINSSYIKETGRSFSDELARFKLPKYMGKTLAAGWRFLE